MHCPVLSEVRQVNPEEDARKRVSLSRDITQVVPSKHLVPALGGQPRPVRALEVDIGWIRALGAARATEPEELSHSVLNGVVNVTVSEDGQDHEHEKDSDDHTTGRGV